MAEARAARLAATEARLSGVTSPSASSATTSNSNPNISINKESSWKPSDKGDLEKKKEFTKLLYRGVVRDNGYREASVCVDTLIKISSNILSNPTETKFRELKASNQTIKSRVLDVKSGHEYLILLGFRTRTIAFEKQYILEPTMKRLHELKLGNEVLSEAATELRSRVNTVTTSSTNHQSEEATRRARALAEYEADRDLVKERVKRDKIAREARELKAKEAAEAAALGEEEVSTETYSHGHDHGQSLHQGQDDDEDEDEDDDNDEDEDDEDDEDGAKRYARQMRSRGGWGQGNVLGK